MRILILSDTFPPARSSGAILLRDLAIELYRLGNEVLVVAPTSRQERLQLCNEEGVGVLRVPMPPLKDINYISRSLNELLLSRRLFSGLKKADVPLSSWEGVIWYSPTIFLGHLARRLMHVSGCPGYLILRDIFPEWAVDMGLMSRGLAYRFFKRYELLQYRAATSIGIQSPSNEFYFRSLPGNLVAKTETLDNWLGSSTIKALPAELLALKESCAFKVVYAGNMGVAQGLQVFIEAIEKLGKHENIKFIFIGRGSDKTDLSAMVTARGIGSVEFFSEIEPEALNALLEICDLGIVSLDVRHRTHNIPGKFLAYLRAGLPVIAKVNPGNEMFDLVNKEGVGVAIDADDPQRISEALLQLYKNEDEHREMKERAFALFNRRFSARQAAEKILNSFKPGALGTE